MSSGRSKEKGVCGRVGVGSVVRHRSLKTADGLVVGRLTLSASRCSVCSERKPSEDDPHVVA